MNIKYKFGSSLAVVVLLLFISQVSFAQPASTYTMKVGAVTTIMGEGTACGGAGCYNCASGSATGSQWGFIQNLVETWPGSTYSGGYATWGGTTYASPTTITVGYYTRTFNIFTGCTTTYATGTLVKNITVNVVADLTWVGTPPTTVCQNGASINLANYTNYPAGAVWRVDGVDIAGTTFNPSLYTAGAHTLTAYYNFGNGQTVLTGKTITVNAPAAISATLPAVACSTGVDLNLNSYFTLSGGTSFAFSCVGGTCGAGLFYTSGPSTFLNLDGLGTGTTFSSTIRATANDANGCSTFVDQVITIDAVPAVSSIYGGGGYCQGGAGVPIYLTTSLTGTSYQLLDGTTPVLGAQAGTNGMLTWSGIGNAGTNYKVTATKGSCSIDMTGILSVVVNPLPTLYTVGGGGAICSGSSTSITLSGSEAGVNYQLKVGGVNDGAAVAGTGAALSWTNMVWSGNYTIVATNATTSCSQTMTGTATITVNPLPTLYTVGGGGAICSGSSASITLSGSQTGVNYQLKVGGVNDGAAVAGTGAALSWTGKTAAGSYTVVATNPTTTCSQSMTGTATITVNPLPTLYTVGGGGAICSGSTTSITLGIASQIGVNYQLKKDGVNDGTAIAGTGIALSWTGKSAAGTYTVVATNATTSCTATMTGSAVITITPLPTLYTVGGGGAICPGASTSITLSGSQSGVNYQLKIGGVNDGAVLGGTGAALSWTGKTAAGTYTVVATNATTTCSRTMTGTTTITANPLPTLYTVGGGGAICSGSSASITLSGSQTGVNYQLKVGGVNDGAAVAGTGAALSWTGKTAAGSYTVVATNPTTTCSQSMTGTATLSINANNTVTFLNPAPNICTGTGTVDLTTVLSPSSTGGTFSSTNTTINSLLSGVEKNILSINTLAVGSFDITYSITGACPASGSTTINFIQGATAPVVADIKLCAPGIGTLDVVTPDVAMEYEWYDVATGGTLISKGASLSTPFLTTDKTYYVEAINPTSLCRSIRDAGLVSVVNIGVVSAGLSVGFCDNNVSINLAADASPVGGVFTGDGVTNGVFDGNTVANNASYPITYTVTVNGCTASDVRVISLGFDIKLTITPNDTTDMGKLVTINHNYPNAIATTWDFGDSWVSSEKAGKHYYYTPGPKSITVYVQLPGGCSQTVTFKDAIFVNEGSVILITGDILNEKQPTTTGVTAYPNPLTSHLYVQSDVQLGKGSAFFYDITGRPISKQPILIQPGSNLVAEESEIDALAPGIYILQIKYNQSVQNIKLLKK